MATENEYECAISGLMEPGGLEEDSDGLEDMPAGWTKITIQTRRWNPKWQAIQAVKEVSVEALLSQVPDEFREDQRLSATIQVEASLHGLESATPKYLTDEVEVFVSDSEDVAEALAEAKALLGIEEDEDDSDDE